MIAYRQDIDGLRALAVLAVLIFHFDLGVVPAGYLGVDIFFVLSGYLITLMIVKDVEIGEFSLLNFWERRIRRILPALVVMLVVTLLAGWIILLPPDYALMGKQVLMQTLFSANVHFARQVGYFDLEAASRPLLHTWSLSVEEKFYLFFPLLFLFVKQVRRLPLLLLAVLSISYAACIYGSFYNPFKTFYLMPVRACELLLGALIVFMPNINFSRFESEALAAFSICTLVGILIFGPAYTTHLWAVILIPCLSTFILLWLGVSHGTYVAKFLGLPPFRFLGLISYSLYLWHWPVFVYASYVSPLGPVEKGVAILLSFLLAVLSWRYVEQPVRTCRIFKTRASLFRAAIMTGISFFLIGFTLSSLKGIPDRFSDRVSGYASAALEKQQDPCQQKSSRQIRQGELCKIGSTDRPASFIVYGDSHVAPFKGVLDEMAKSKDVSGLLASTNSCPPIFGITRPDHQKSYECKEVNTAVKELLADSEIRHVILAGRWAAYTDLYLVGDDKTPVPASFKENTAILKMHFVETVRQLQGEGMTVWIVEQPPEYKFNVPRHLANLERRGLQSPGGQDLQVYMKRLDIADQLIASAPGLRRIALHPYLCFEGLCQMGRDGISFYKDSHHLSHEGAQIVAPAFKPFMAALEN